MIAMHLHIVYRRACPLHLHHPVLRQVGTDGGVFSTLQHEERCRGLADVADGPPLLVVGPLAGTANLRGRRTTGGTSHAGCQASHQRQVAAC